ncbi:MAG: glycosyltransferase family 2 protein, partial [SAR324 cluster bacterium]|nr:glycosyltransferase family 2 protein [SAR324 cluster bacterium]
FLENYQVDLIKKHNTEIFITLQKFRKFKTKYNLKKISDFYLKNSDYTIDFTYFAKKIIPKLLK